MRKGGTASPAEKQPFRMPLHSKDRKFVMDDSFDNTIVGGLDNPQFPSEPVYRLMVGAVSDYAFPVEFFEKRSFLHGGGMQLIPVFPCVAGGFCHILDDRSSEIDIDNLHSLTNAKDRPF